MPLYHHVDKSSIYCNCLPPRSNLEPIQEEVRTSLPWDQAPSCWLATSSQLHPWWSRVVSQSSSWCAAGKPITIGSILWQLFLWSATTSPPRLSFQQLLLYLASQRSTAQPSHHLLITVIIKVLAIAMCRFSAATTIRLSCLISPPCLLLLFLLHAPPLNSTLQKRRRRR